MIIVINTLLFFRHVGYVTLSLNCELVSKVILGMVSVFPDIIKDYPTIRNLPKILLKSFENEGPDSPNVFSCATHTELPDHYPYNYPPINSPIPC